MSPKYFSNGICPRCHLPRINVERPPVNAVSRVDSDTYICAPCGSAEGLLDMLKDDRLEVSMSNADEQILISERFEVWIGSGRPGYSEYVKEANDDLDQ